MKATTIPLNENELALLWSAMGWLPLKRQQSTEASALRLKIGEAQARLKN